MRINRMVIIPLIGISLLTYTGCSSQPASTEKSAAKTTVKKQYVESFGVVKSKDVHNIILDFPAKVVKIPVTDSQKVTKGNVIFEMDFSEFRKQISSKESDLKIANIELEKLETNSTTENSEIKRLRADIAQKQAALANLTDPDIIKLKKDLEQLQYTYQKEKEDLDKKLELLNLGSISKTEYEQAEKELKVKQMQIDGTISSIESLKKTKQQDINQLIYTKDQKLAEYAASNSSISSFSIKLQQEKVKVLADELQQMKDKLNKPYIQGDNIVVDYDNAVISDISCTSNDIISAANKIATLSSTDALYIEGNVSEEFIKDISIGSTATIIPAYDRIKELKGKVTKIGEKALVKNAESVVPIELSVEDSKDLKVLFNVDLKIDKSESK